MLTDLSHTPIAVTLWRLASDRKSGDLQVRAGKVVKTVFFDHGRVVFAASNVKKDRLGEALVALGRITQDDFNRATSLFKDKKKPRIGEALIAAGILEKQELGRSVARQVERIVLSLFTIEDGVAAFEERPCPIPLEFMVSLSIRRLLYQGIKAMKNRELVVVGLGDLDRRSVVAVALRLRPRRGLGGREGGSCSRPSARSPSAAWPGRQPGSPPRLGPSTLWSWRLRRKCAWERRLRPSRWCRWNGDLCSALAASPTLGPGGGGGRRWRRSLLPGAAQRSWLCRSWCPRPIVRAVEEDGPLPLVPEAAGATSHQDRHRDRPGRAFLCGAWSSRPRQRLRGARASKPAEKAKAKPSETPRSRKNPETLPPTPSGQPAGPC